MTQKQKVIRFLEIQKRENDMLCNFKKRDFYKTLIEKAERSNLTEFFDFLDSKRIKAQMYSKSKTAKFYCWLLGTLKAFN